jgi:hypothetical protein
MKGIFSLTTPVDLFRKLEHDFELMQQDPKDQYAAFNFFVTAEHMADWLHPGYENKKKIKKIRDSEVVLQVTSHLANGAKHFQAQAKHHKSVVKAEKTGYFGPGYFQEDYFGEWLFVELTGEAAAELGKSIRVNELAKKVLDFWRDQLPNWKENQFGF